MAQAETKKDVRGPDESDLLSRYFREMDGTRLLTSEEEVHLGRGVAEGDQDARARLIESNLRLVIMVARRYVGLGLPLIDLIEEGNLGLIRAVDKFDPDRGCRFSTYGIYWIRQALGRAVASQGRTIRLPYRVSDDLRQLDRQTRCLSHELGRPPRDEEILEATGFTKEHLHHLRSLVRRTASLEQELDDEGDLRLGDSVAAAEEEDPSDRVWREKVRGILLEKIHDLDPRERKILRLRFGLEGDETLTLEKIGTAFNLTRERIRQIQNEALAKLRETMQQDGLSENALL